MVYSVCPEQSLSTGKPAVSKFDYLRRHEVIDYVTQKYGKERVSQVATFSSLSTKAVLKDVARILDIDHTLINEINKHVPVVFGKPYTIERCLGEVDAIREFAEKYPRLFELALELQSMPRSAGIHACAIMISPNNISEEIPLMKGKNDEVVTQYEGPVMEENGYIKFDFLGLKNLSVIDISRRLVRERHKKDIDPDKLVPDDPRVFETIRSGRTQGLFQIEGQGITKVFTGLNVVDFESLIAGVSLYRPGPMAFIPDYQARANKLQEVKYFHEDGKEVLESTFGIMVYQEQLMKLSQRLAGYSAGEADMLRKACGKKSQAVMDKVLPELRQRTIENGYEPRIADQLVKLIEPFVGYGFNRSHAAAYAYIAYQTAYFKTYYPAEFYTALLTIFADDDDKVVRYITEAKESGISVLPPDVNKSDTQFVIDDEQEGLAIRYGFDAIKSFGPVAQKALLEERLENGPFHDLEDLLARVPRKSLNKTSLRALSMSGALDLIHPSDNRMEIFQLICILREFKDDLTAEIQAFNKKAQLEKEKEYVGVYLSGHPLDGIGIPVDWEDVPDDDPIVTTGVVVRIKEVLTKKKQEPMAFITLDFLEGSRDLVIFPRDYADVRALLQEDLVVKVKCYFKYNPMRDERSLIIDRMDIPKRINRHILQG